MLASYNNNYYHHHHLSYSNFLAICLFVIKIKGLCSWKTLVVMFLELLAYESGLSGNMGWGVWVSLLLAPIVVPTRSGCSVYISPVMWNST